MFLWNRLQPLHKSLLVIGVKRFKVYPQPVSYFSVTPKRIKRVGCCLLPGERVMSLSGNRFV